MRILKSFQDCLNEGIAKKITQDNERAKNLAKESQRKNNSLKEQIEKIGIKEENANDYVEYCYDIIIYLIRAKMYKDGYNANGQGAHEAEVSYLRVLKVDEKEVQFMNELRYYRNGILYYGTRMDKEYAMKVIDYSKKILPKLKEMI
jgi:hypothetical protein